MKSSNFKSLLSIVSAILFFTSCASQNTNKADTSQLNKEDFHLYLLMGQSNMAGRGAIGALDTITHPRVMMLDKKLDWVLAKDPIHFDKSAAGTGLGLTFGKIMADSEPNVSIGLIPTAVGGSSINYWVRDSLFSQTNTYPYNDMILRAIDAMKDGKLKGILWHQGESDTDSEEAVTSYAQKFEKMMESLKSDLGLESIPMVIGELGYFHYDKNPRAKQLNAILNQIAEADPCIAIVSAEGLDHKGDVTHFNSKSYHKLGKRYAAKMQDLQKSCSLIFKK